MRLQAIEQSQEGNKPYFEKIKETKHTLRRTLDMVTTTHNVHVHNI